MGRILEAMIACGKQGDGVLEGHHAQAAVRQVQAAAARGGIRYLHAASRTAERLVGAVVYVSGGELSVWQPNVSGSVLVIDVETLSDIAVKQAVTRLADREHDVAALIVGTEPIRSDVAEVVILAGRDSAHKTSLQESAAAAFFMADLDEHTAGVQTEPGHGDGDRAVLRKLLG